MTPLVLLDVDGVLNALTADHPAWSRWERGLAHAGGRPWAVRWSPDVVAAVAGWADRAEVRWLTTWGHDAPGELAALLGLPELAVAGTFAEGLVPAATADAPSLADVTPAAPDALTGRWWKLDVVRELVAAEPGRPLVWLDDDLAGQVDLQLWLQEHVSDLLLVAPDPRSGLTPRDLADVDRFLVRSGA